MARVPNIDDYNSGRDFRQEPLKLTTDGETYLVTHKEVKAVLKDYINEELLIHTLETSNEYKKEINRHVKHQFDGFVEEINQLVNQRINQAAEEIVGKLLDYHVKGEIERIVDERLKKIKDSL